MSSPDPPPAGSPDNAAESVNDPSLIALERGDFREARRLPGAGAARLRPDPLVVALVVLAYLGLVVTVALTFRH